MLSACIISEKVYTYSNQSTAMINETSSAGSPNVSKTITIVTNPACGIPAAPIDAIVAVTLITILNKQIVGIKVFK